MLVSGIRKKSMAVSRETNLFVKKFLQFESDVLEIFKNRVFILEVAAQFWVGVEEGAILGHIPVSGFLNFNLRQFGV